jgi:tetratricopeptide (TPR) repeat protein
MEQQNVDNASLFPLPDVIQQVPQTSSLFPQSLGSIREPPEMFIVCSRGEQDARLCSQLQQGLSHLRRAGVMTLWHEAMIVPGGEQQQEMERHLEQATLILLLLSPDFLDSDVCYAMQQRAMEKHRKQEASVIPIVVRPCDWEETFKFLEVLPTNHKPITSWSNRDQAFLDVVRSIRRMIDELIAPSSSRSAIDTKAIDQKYGLPAFWSIQYQRNPFFTGRERVLFRLHDLLTAQKRATLTQALTGLGGIGKTQTAVEYAYRYQHEYTAVLWARADSREALTTNFVTMADILGLSLSHEQDQHRVVHAVLQWFNTHTNWLLIFDDVQEIEMLDDFLPKRETGHILLTTRIRAVGTGANTLEIEKMPLAEGILFLLRRAKIIRHDDPVEMASEHEQESARAIAEILDGLPLALDQAGAYIEETGCSFIHYLELYVQRRAILLKKRGKIASGHSASVATTFSLCFEKVAQVNRAATDLLRCCALLHPDDIPEELFTESATELGPVLHSVVTDPFAFDEVIAELFHYSLIHRSVEANMLSIHRLVQAVLLDEMGEQFQHIWAERVVKALCNVFPGRQLTTWQHMQRYLIHIQVCAALIDRWNMRTTDVEEWLLHVGYCVENSGFYSLAETLYLQRNALIKNDVSGMIGAVFGASWADYVTNSPAMEMLTSVSPLPQLYYQQGKYQQAELQLQRAIMLIEQIFGSEHMKLAEPLNLLGALYSTIGKYAEAETHFQRALTLCLRASSVDVDGLAASFNNLADLYRKQGKYEQAEPLYQQALRLNETRYGQDHIRIANLLHNLALLYRAQKKYLQAEILYQRALPIYERTYGPESPDLANVLNSLGALYSYQQKYSKVEPLLLRALVIREKVLGTEHADVGRTLNNLGNLYLQQEKYVQARQTLQRSLQIYTQSFGAEHLETAMVLANLGHLYNRQHQYAQAESVLEKAFNIYEKAIGLQCPEAFLIFQELVIAYVDRKKFVQAHILCQRMLPALSERLGSHHKDVQNIQNLLLGLSQKI